MRYRLRACLAIATVLAFATKAQAATPGPSDAGFMLLGYIFVGVPLYVLLMVAALFARFFASGRTAARNLGSLANLLPIAMGIAFLAYYLACYLVIPLVPDHYSTVGLITWGCILSPFPLVVIMNWFVSRSSKLHQLTSSLWWTGLYGAAAVAVVVYARS
jgi:hypothetical protein